MKQLVDFTEAVFDALGYLNKFHGLVKTVNRSVDGEVKKYPAKIGFEEVPIDFEPKMAYMRLGQVTTTPLDEDACSRRVTKSFPFTLVVGLPEDILSTPNEYIALKVAQNISNSLQSTQTNSLRTAIKADDVEVNISDIQIDPYTVWTNERNDHYEYPTDRILISMEVTFVIQGHVACFAILGCDDVETELVQQYTDSDGVEKEFPFGGHPVCTPCEAVVFCDEFTAASVAEIEACFDLQSGARKTAIQAAICDPCPGLDTYTCAQLNDATTGLTQAQRDFLQKISLLKTGQTTSYYAEDDGDLENGRYDLVLPCNNPNGNTNRFETIVHSAVNVIYDWGTRLQWNPNVQAATNYPAASALAIASTYGGFTDWFIPNIRELESILRFGLAPGVLNYAPFSIDNAAHFWSSTRVNILLDRMYTVELHFGQRFGDVDAAGLPYLLCREF